MIRGRFFRQSPATAAGTIGPRRSLGGTADGIWYAVATLLCLGLVFAGAVASASVSPRFCSLCHADAAVSLQASSHVTLDCDSCHVQAGTLGLLESRMQVVSMVAAAPFVLATGGDGGSVDATGNKPCLVCHAELMPRTIQRNGVRMNHRTPEEDGWLCSDCHRGASHPNEAYSGVSYSMDKCLRCHSVGVDNLNTCSTCHIEGSEPRTTQPTAWRATHGTNWQRTHGMGDLTTCRACHSLTYCNACHGISLPHPANFLAAHGKTVVENEGVRDDCVVCHKGPSCDNCHGLAMPHPAGFTKTHSAQAKDDVELCYRCHNDASCEACHVRHTHPGIPENQLKRLHANPVSNP